MSFLLNVKSMLGASKNWSYVFILLFLSGCATYYQRHQDFNTAFETGNLQQAIETLQKNDKEANGRERFIYYANKGLLLSILGQYTESNDSFEKAFLFGEDYRINYFNEAASYFTNPMVTVYRGEDHEHLMVLYFKAINFLKMNKPEDALIECRRLNIRLNQLTDKYTSEEKFQRDAFIHTLMGIIYQSTQDYNNAFIAYRNALEVYEDTYARLFHMEVPMQLKIDLLNTSYWLGFTEEYEFYKEKFSMTDYLPKKPEAELVFFWHNGLAPVKQEWSINFVMQRQSDDVVVFVNESMGLSFPFSVADKSKQEKSNLANLEVYRVAFPKYYERPPYYKSASLQLGDSTYVLQLAEDINQVAFTSLRQRMVLEFSKGLLRAAIKKSTEHSMRNDDERLGALIGLVNAMTEKADTRNWTTLPHSIFYARLPLQEGTNQITFSLEGIAGQPVTYPFSYRVAKGQTLFHTFSSLESTVH